MDIYNSCLWIDKVEDLFFFCYNIRLKRRMFKIENTEITPPPRRRARGLHVSKKLLLDLNKRQTEV